MTHPYYYFTAKSDGSMRTERAVTQHFQKVYPEIKNAVVVGMDQIHSNTVKKVTLNGKAFFLESSCDGLVYKKNSSSPVFLTVKSADCVPLLFADENAQVIAVAHSGWKGSLSNIVSETVKKMLEEGATVDNIRVYIGPSIGSCCYSILPERVKLFRDKYQESFSSFIEEREGAVKLNLTRLVYEQMLHEGIKKEAIVWKNCCTSCQDDTYFSFRREGGGMGMMMGYISI